MPTILLHPPDPARKALSLDPGAIPSLLQTPLGLAIMEMQGHINVPSMDEADSTTTRVGRLVFPDYDISQTEAAEGPWMKKVYFYVGHQRMLGQIKRLPKPVAVIGRKGLLAVSDDQTNVDVANEELEILEIVKWKIVFSSRPEPVGEDDQD